MTILGITDWSELHCLIEFFVDLISWLEHHLSNDKYPSDLILFFFFQSSSKHEWDIGQHMQIGQSGDPQKAMVKTVMLGALT